MKNQKITCKAYTLRKNQKSTAKLRIKEEIPPSGTIEVSLDHSPVFAEATKVFLEISTGKEALPFYYDETSNIVFVQVEEGTIGTIQVEYYAP